MIANYQDAFLAHLDQYKTPETPRALYAPVDYILHLGGKRIRPVLALMTADAVANDYTTALDAALAVEVFHNFSLVHDDIMDDATLRRGKPTVHEKWGVNSGILSGDAMLVLAYQCLDGYAPEVFHTLTQLFSKTAREVCEGQQYDMDFPTQKEVTQEEYLEMIRLKTAVLLACSLQMGAITAGLSKEESQVFYDFGIQLGLAFQLQDDYLDAFGDPALFGKQVGGDIIENKKTMLYLMALSLATAEEEQELRSWYAQTPAHPEEKIAAVLSLFQKTKADASIQQKMEAYTQKALDLVAQFPVSTEKKKEFTHFATTLMARQL